MLLCLDLVRYGQVASNPSGYSLVRQVSHCNWSNTVDLGEQITWIESNQYQIHNTYGTMKPCAWIIEKKNHTLKLRIPTISSQFRYLYRVFLFKLAHVVDTIAFKFECCKLLGFYIILQANYVVYSYSDKRLTTPANAVLAWTLTRFVKRYTSAWK